MASNTKGGERVCSQGIYCDVTNWIFNTLSLYDMWTISLHSPHGDWNTSYLLLIKSVSWSDVFWVSQQQHAVGYICWRLFFKIRWNFNLLMCSESYLVCFVTHYHPGPPLKHFLNFLFHSFKQKFTDLTDLKMQ